MSGSSRLENIQNVLVQVLLSSSLWCPSILLLRIAGNNKEHSAFGNDKGQQEEQHCSKAHSACSEEQRGAQLAFGTFHHCQRRCLAEYSSDFASQEGTYNSISKR